MNCTNCEKELSSDEIRWAFDEPYCEDCFYDSYNYCVRCDGIVSRDNSCYDSDGDPYCPECYEQEQDEDCPDNPEVDQNDREIILQLCNCWLKGERPKGLIRINQSDHHLHEIQAKVGLIEKPVYLYGLIDREEYQIKISGNIYNRVSQFTTLNNWDVLLSEDTGVNRLGISRTLREEKTQEVIQLIKELTS